ncbi:MAG: HisA/HisF-related TIM barrel protein, partial [Candidatus Omnitrophota bacterium]
TNKGLRTRELIKILIEEIELPIVVDAGIGRPSHAAQAMEIGAAAVLVNTAVAASDDPVSVARAFSLAVEAGRLAYKSGLSPVRESAQASSPLTGFLR